MNKKIFAGCIIATTLILFTSFSNVISARTIDGENLIQRYNKVINYLNGKDTPFPLLFIFIGFLLGIASICSLIYLVCYCIAVIILMNSQPQL